MPPFHTNAASVAPAGCRLSAGSWNPCAKGQMVHTCSVWPAGCTAARGAAESAKTQFWTARATNGSESAGTRFPQAVQAEGPQAAVGNARHYEAVFLTADERFTEASV